MSRTALFVSSGLGNALLLVPLIKALKKNGNSVTGIFTSTCHCEQLFENSDLLDHSIILKSKADWVKTATTQLKKFDEVYLDYFSSTRKNMILARAIGKKIITNHLPANLPKILWKGIHYIKPEKHIHEGMQNLRLFTAAPSNNHLDEESFRLPVKFEDDELSANAAILKMKHALESPVIAVQISAANNEVKYKNWQVEHWQVFLEKASVAFPGVHFMLLGERNEMELSVQIIGNLSAERQNGMVKVYSLVGKTSVKEAMAIISKCALFMGVDGGLMHIAVALGKPTFTLWGASDFNLYGYGNINPQRHKILYKDLPCRPCNSWINPNTSRVSDPTSCPDIRCMSELSPDLVFGQFRDFANSIL